MNTIISEDAKTAIRINKDNSITLCDRTDFNNYPMAASTMKRGLKKAVAYIQENQAKLEMMSMYSIVNILDDQFNLRMHTWCSMD